MSDTLFLELLELLTKMDKVNFFGSDNMDGTTDSVVLLEDVQEWRHTLRRIITRL